MLYYSPYTLEAGSGEPKVAPEKGRNRRSSLIWHEIPKVQKKNLCYTLIFKKEVKIKDLCGKSRRSIGIVSSIRS